MVYTLIDLVEGVWRVYLVLGLGNLGLNLGLSLL